MTEDLQSEPPLSPEPVLRLALHASIAEQDPAAGPTRAVLDVVLVRDSDKDLRDIVVMRSEGTLDEMMARIDAIRETGMISGVGWRQR